MNWAAFAILVSFACVTSVGLAARRAAGSRIGIGVALVLLIVACLNAAAPLRGLLDPAFAGYRFGLLAADSGWSVTLVAGSVFLLSLASAHVAATCRGGPLLWLVAATCAGLAAVLGLPWLGDMAADPAANIIQLGEYATIPAPAATALMLGTVVAPLVAGAGWATALAQMPARHG